MKILLFRGKGIFSKAIIWFMRGKYSHVAVLFEDGTLYESEYNTGVRKVSSWRNTEKGVVVDVFTLPGVTPEQITIAREFYEKHVGAKYDFKAILGFLLRTRQEDRKGTNKFFCGEYVFCGAEKAKFKILERIEPFMVDPEKFSYSPVLKYETTT
jgi:uncharacterized protein YycO